MLLSTKLNEIYGTLDVSVIPNAQIREIYISASKEVLIHAYTHVKKCDGATLLDDHQLLSVTYMEHGYTLEKRLEVIVPIKLPDAMKEVFQTSVSYSYGHFSHLTATLGGQSPHIFEIVEIFNPKCYDEIFKGIEWSERIMEIPQIFIDLMLKIGYQFNG